MSRDTDADWARIAETEPYFGVLANAEYLSDNLDAEAEERFFVSGQGDITHVVNTIRGHLAPDFAPELAVDFGCGVGRLTFAMAGVSERVVGVDVAPAMREIAARKAESFGIANVSFSEAIPSEGVDWVNSLIVVQHIPPERGYGLLAALLGSIRPGGVFSVQLTTHRDARHMFELLRDVELARYDGADMQVYSTVPSTGPGQMSMYDYDLGRVFAMLVMHGFQQMWIEHTDHAGVHGAWIFARRAGV
ncbi:MAG: hypothetical protein JWN62_855 [Acidimicrobiales bacterium]|nr:hypothetical protein [Acidimicrobiales bacterium]